MKARYHNVDAFENVVISGVIDAALRAAHVQECWTEAHEYGVVINRTKPKAPRRKSRGV